MKRIFLLVLTFACLLSFAFVTQARSSTPPVNFPLTYFTGSYDGSSSGYFAGKLLENTVRFMSIDADTGAFLSSSATIKPDKTFSKVINRGGGVYTTITGTINADLTSSGTWETAQGKDVLESGTWSATPMNPTVVQEGAGVWTGSWSARVYVSDPNSPSGYTWEGLSGSAGLVTLDDYTVVAIVVYVYRGYYYYMTFSGTWDATTKQVSVSDDAGYGFSGYGKISSKSISGSLYQDVTDSSGNTYTLKAGNWSVSKF